MTWTTCDGRKVMGAWEFIARPTTKWTERDKDLIRTYQELERLAMNQDHEVLRLRLEVSQLRAENNFMHRFINEHMQTIPDA